MIYRILIFLISLLLLIGCSENNKNSRLTRISEIVSESPKEALACLDSVDYKKLSSYDKNFFDLLTIKAKDKAYIRHTSDSSFVRVYNYYSNHHTAELYPEVLYYGGRVYSDLGDYPTALNHFQNALELLPKETKNLKLRCKVLSQTGRLLNSLRLYEEAIPYIEGALELDTSLNDSINEVYDLQLLGTIYLRAHNYTMAEKCFFTAFNKSQYLPESHSAKSRMYIASVKYRIGQIDSALIFIRNTPELVKPMARNSALACAAEIYSAAGVNDTAFQYALELVHSNDYTNKESGYQILLSPLLRNRLSPDSIDKYLTSYLALLESYFNENENQLALNQQSFYNYEFHERERAKAEKSNEILINCIIGISFITLSMGLIILFLKNRNKNNIIKLHEALENVDRLKESLTHRQNNDSDIQNNIEILPIKEQQETIKDLRKRLREKLYSIYLDNCSQSFNIPPLILQSEPYHKLQILISKGEGLKETDRLWKGLEEIVLKSSPKFIEHLQLLVGGKLTSYDLHTALLIKCGVSPSQMTILLNRSKGAIVSRIESLCFRVFDEKLGTKVIDGIIRLL